MNTGKVYLIIIIKYKNKKYKFETEDLLNYKDLKLKSINYFDINKEKEEFMEFIYLDEDNDKNILGYKDKVFDAAREIDNGNYLLELELTINEPDKNKNNNEIIFVKKDNENKNKNKILENNENNENKENKKIENELNHKLNKLHLLYKNKIKNIKQDIIQIFNKYNELEKIIEIKNDINDIDMGNNINKDNDNNSINENILEEKDKPNLDNSIHIEHSLILNNEVVNISTDDREKEYNLIYKENDNEDWEEVKEDIEKEKVPKNKNSKINALFNFIKKNKPDDKINSCLEEIKNIIKKINKNNIEEDYIVNGKNIYKIMEKNNLNKKQINDYMFNYIFNGAHRKSKEDKITYYNILKKINYYIEIEKINKSIYKLLEKENKINYENIEESFKSLNDENFDKDLREKIMNILKNKDKNN